MAQTQCQERRRFRLALSVFVLFLAAAAGCRCGDGGTSKIDATFAPLQTRLDFGRVREDDTAHRTLVLAATGQGDVEVALSVTAPFGAVSQVTVPGSGQVMVDVLFVAGNTFAEGTLTLDSATQHYEVTLTGQGVRPKECLPSRACRVAHYDFDSDSCKEALSAEGAQCEPDSLCLEKGECHAGVCQGVARSCNDHDACTVDACANDVGCVQAPRVCPAPSNPCRVAACDSDQGCGEADAPVGTVCGAVNCVMAQLCFSGQCQTVPTPDGFLCSPKSPCQGEGRCMNQRCVRPDAGALSPEFVLGLSGEPVFASPGLLGAGGNLFAEVCGVSIPAEPVDGGDGGIDGGVSLGCALVSWTGSGFERFTVPHGDGGERQLLHVSGGQVAFLADGVVLEMYAARNGALSAVVPLGGMASASAVSTGNVGEVYVCAQSADAGAVVWRVFADGGQSWVGDAPGAAYLATDEHGSVHAYAPDSGMLSAFSLLDDGGYAVLQRDAGQHHASLVVVQNQAWVGATSFFPSDAGAALWHSTLLDGGNARLLENATVLANDNLGIVFVTQCPSPLTSCMPSERTVVAHAIDLASGADRWEVTVADAGEVGTLKHVAQLSVPLGAVATVTQRHPLDGGVQTALEAYGNGQRLMFCPFAGEGTLQAAVFESGLLYTVFARDAGYTLEAYDVAVLPFSTQGWPAPNGVSGARRARP